jgi:trimeric autotransporter adhesin
MATNPTLVRDEATATSTDLAQAGAVYNDATRLLDGGLWSTPFDAHNQQAYLGMYTTDITAVSNDIAAMLANPGQMTVGGVAFTPSTTDTAVLTEVESQLQTLLTVAPNAVGNSHHAIDAQATLHTVQAEILNEINGDSALATALGNAAYMNPGTGANDAGFQALPQGADDPFTLAQAKTGASLATIGQVFNAAADLADGGLNHTNLGQFGHDMSAIQHGLENLLNNPTELAQIETGENATSAALTTIHLQTMLNQIDLQINTFDKEYASNPNVAARATNDNLLDIIDIVQGDANLNAAAGGNGTPGHVGGFGEMPGYLQGTITHYQDNQTQTNFWAAFIAEANTINNTLQAVANGTSTADIGQLITQIENYNSFGANFAHGQGGIFGARFINELTDGTLKADSAAAVQGLTGILNGDTGAALAHDQAQILAAGQGFVADANDVSGNNIPIGGGAYVGDATTVATATSVNGIAHGTVPVPAGAGTGGGSHDASPQVAELQHVDNFWHHA